VKLPEALETRASVSSFVPRNNWLSLPSALIAIFSDFQRFSAIFSDFQRFSADLHNYHFDPFDLILL
jgi:hypothetical protein